MLSWLGTQLAAGLRGLSDRCHLQETLRRVQTLAAEECNQGGDENEGGDENVLRCSSQWASSADSMEVLRRNRWQLAGTRGLFSNALLLTYTFGVFQTVELREGERIPPEFAFFTFSVITISFKMAVAVMVTFEPARRSKRRDEILCGRLATNRLGMRSSKNASSATSSISQRDTSSLCRRLLPLTKCALGGSR